MGEVSSSSMVAREALEALDPCLATGFADGREEEGGGGAFDDGALKATECFVGTFFLVT